MTGNADQREGKCLVGGFLLPISAAVLRDSLYGKRTWQMMELMKSYKNKVITEAISQVRQCSFPQRRKIGVEAMRRNDVIYLTVMTRVQW